MKGCLDLLCEWAGAVLMPMDAAVQRKTTLCVGLPIIDKHVDNTSWRHVQYWISPHFIWAVLKRCCAEYMHYKEQSCAGRKNELDGLAGAFHL